MPVPWPCQSLLLVSLSQALACQQLALNHPVSPPPHPHSTSSPSGQEPRCLPAQESSGNRPKTAGAQATCRSTGGYAGSIGLKSSDFSGSSDGSWCAVVGSPFPWLPQLMVKMFPAESLWLSLPAGPAHPEPELWCGHDRDVRPRSQHCGGVSLFVL